MRHQTQPCLARILGGLLLAAGALGAMQCASSGKGPNIVLITLDTTRADRLGCYGYALASSPHLDRVAQEAVLFENAMTTVPLTLPSHASILTGQIPPVHGVHNNGTFILPPAAHTITEDLAAHGYTTAAFVSCFVLNRQFGLGQGFQVYDDDLVAEERKAAETTRRAIRWLQSAPDTPFFLWVHYFDPHTPYEPPEPYASATRGTPYDAEISSMDAGVGELLDTLRRLDLYDDAHIVILADHGEGLGDHRELEHGIFLYEGCLRIPFLWKLPGRHVARRIPEPVGIVDVVPTLLEFANLPPPAQTDGHSLHGLLTGGPAPERTGLYAETMYPYYSYNWSPLYGWRTDQWKYIEAPVPELYDLTRDPREENNVAAEQEETAHRLAKYLRTARLRGGSSGGLPSAQEMDPAVAEKLASLGYVWSGVSQESATLDSLPDPKAMIQYHEHFEKGKLALADGRPAEAIPEFDALLSAYPENHTATYLMGLALLKEDRPQEALYWLERHMELGDDPAATLAMGQALLQLGRAEDALTWFAKHLAGGSQKAAAHEFSGDAHAELGRYDQALAAYQQASALSTTVRSLWKEAITLIRLGRGQEALERLRAGAERPDAGDRAAWEAWIRAAERLQPYGLERPAGDATGLAAQVRSAAQLALYREARELIDRSQAGHSEAFLLGLRGDVAAANQDWPAARRAYQRADELGVDWDFEQSMRRAMVCMRLEEYACAAGLLRRAIGQGADQRGIMHYNLACALALAGDRAGALAALAGAGARGYPNLPAAAQDPDLASLRGHPEFERLTSPSGQ